ncbi:MAG: hypothetical protein U9N59_00935 [Campylobacterota bacterium]|nr:hypothetical protein [Campylobacterota bacterium]
MTQRDMAGYLNITPVTLRNWRKNKPNLYKIVLQGFALEDTLNKAQQNIDELKELVEALNKK